jgi:hypothetical protein
MASAGMTNLFTPNGVLLVVGGGSLSIFAGMIEVEKGNVRHVDDSVLKGGRSEDGQFVGVVDETQGGWGNALWGRVHATPTG